uniref:C2H2-type domain-containing protein n=1 Tax=Eptatretus burgeri TaxID=7764 RepID=A0A8C4WXJ8_EPTBU
MKLLSGSRARQNRRGEDCHLVRYIISLLLGFQSFLPEKEMKIVSFTNSAQLFDTEDHFNQQMPSSQDKDKSSSVSSDNYKRCFSMIEEIQRKKKSYNCFMCNKAYTSSSCLYRHQQIHTGHSPRRILACSGVFCQTPIRLSYVSFSQQWSPSSITIQQQK